MTPINIHNSVFREGPRLKEIVLVLVKDKEYLELVSMNKTSWLAMWVWGEVEWVCLPCL